MTVAQWEHIYTRKERNKATQAGEFVKNAGYPSHLEAIQIIGDGNIQNIPYSVDDVKHLYDIYGPLPTEIRNKTTNKKAATTNQVDEGLKE